MGIHQRSKRHALALFAGVLVMGLVVAPTAAVGQNPPDPVSVDRGVLVLELGAEDRFVHYDSDGHEVASQPITKQGCKVSLGTDTLLVTLDAIPSTSDVGLFADGIGVKTKGSGGNGQPCGRVDGPDEGLILALAGDLAEGAIARAELDIEGKFNADVVADLYNGTSFVESVVLATGTQSDSGPDSADGDNYRWIIDPGVEDVADIVFTSIVLTVGDATPGGSFSLEGGADGTAPGPLGISGSAFALVDVFDGVVDCGEPTFTVGDGDETPGATFTRGDDDTKNPDPCSELIGYNLESFVDETAGEQTVSFEFETDEAPSWFGTFDWTPEPAQVPVPPTQVDGEDLVWCDGFSGVDASTGNALPVMPDGESWCLITQTSTLLTDGTIQVTQTIYGESDPDFLRPK